MFHDKFKSMFEPRVVVKSNNRVEEVEEPDDEASMIVVRPPKPPMNYLPGERLLRKIGNARKTRKEREAEPDVDRISDSLARIMRDLV